MSGSIQRLDRPRPWRARYRGPDGKQRSRSFARKLDTERWLRTEIGHGDPFAARTTPLSSDAPRY